MSLLSAVGTFSYNGYTFNGSTKSAVASRMVYDQAQRTVAYVVYTLKARTLVQSSSGTDSTMLDLRNRLTKPGQSLVYTGHGFGDFSINTSEGSTSQKDVVYGPKPIRCEFESLGIPNAWAVEWECEVAIPQCTSAKYRFALLAFNYEVGYQIDEHGLTTRTYSGYLEIPVTRWIGGSRKIPDTADSYWEKIVPPLVPGFQRKSDRKVSPDKRTLTFTIVDSQMKGDGLPVYCTAATGKHSVASEHNNVFNYHGTIQATYQVAYGEPKTRGWEAFALLVNDRLGHVQKSHATNAVYLTSAKMEEGLYSDGREMTFELGYFLTADIQSIMEQAGQWRPISGTEWAKWAESMRLTQGPRGTANLFHNRNDDAIIDLCVSDPPAEPRDRPFSLKGKTTQEFSLRTNPGSTWVGFENILRTVGDPGTSTLKTLPTKQLNPAMSTGGPLAEPQRLSTKPPMAGGSGTAGVSGTWQGPWRKITPPPAVSANDDPTTALVEGPGEQSSPAERRRAADMPLDEWTARLVKLQHMNRFHNVRDLLGLYKNFPPALGAFKHRKPKQPLATELEQNPDILQQRTTPSYIVWMYGWGVRVGYYVPYPTLYTVGGTGAVPAGRGYFEQWVGANWGGYPVYCARWAIPFRLLQPPKNAVGVPQNPALLVRG